MLVWLIKEGEPLPCDGENVRLFRMGILAEALAASGHDIVWWSSTFNHAEKKFRYQEARNIKVKPNYELRLIHANAYKRNISLGRIIHQRKTAEIFEREAKICTKPDIIVVSMPTIDFTCKAVQFGLGNKIPVVADIRDLWPDIYEDYFPTSMKPFIRMLSSRSKKKLAWALKNTTGIVGLTQPYLQWGLDYAGKVAREYDCVFPLGYIDAQKRTPQDAVATWKEIGLNKSDFICCFFGQIGYAADIETIIETARLCTDKDIKFVICGTGEKLEVLKEKAACLDNIYFPGWINADRIRALADISSVGLMPYKPSKNYEMNMPNKFAEFLSFGLPIMVQPAGLMSDAVKKHNCGLHYDNENNLTANIKKLKEDKGLLSEMSKNSRNLYEEGFRADKIYSDMIEYLQRIVNEWA